MTWFFIACKIVGAAAIWWSVVQVWEVVKLMVFQETERGSGDAT